MRSGDTLKPRSWDAMHRAFNRTEAKAGAEHVVLFGGPENLIRLAYSLANSFDPPAERLICHPVDYKAAGLHKFGSETYISIQDPKLPPLRPPVNPCWRTAPRKAALRPVEGCPRGEVWVDLSDPGRRKRAGL